MSAKISKNLKPGLALVLIPFFFACDDQLSSGIELQNEQPKVESLYVEFALPTATVYIDSLRTNQTQTAVFGDYTDSIAGRIRATAFLKYAWGSGVIPDDTMEYSRVFVAFRVNDAVSDNPLQGEVLNLYQTDDSLYSELTYLSNTVTPYGASGPITTQTFDFNPAIDSILQFDLPSSFGQFLYDRLYSYNLGGDYRDSVLSNLYYYPPLVLEPGAGNQGLFSFDFTDDTTAIYIETVGRSGEKYYHPFRFDKTPHYTQITRDLSSGKLSDLTQEYVESTTPSSRAYLSPLAGLHTKVSLDPFIAFLDTAENIIINQADFAFGAAPKTVSYLEVLSPIQMFFLSDSTKINGVGKVSSALSPLLRTSAVMDESSYVSSNSVIQNSSYNETKSWFRGRMTLFLQDFVDRKNIGYPYLTEDLLIHTGSPLSIQKASFIKSEMKLRVFYTKLK